MIIQKYINPNWEAKREFRKSDYYKRNKSAKHLSDNNKIGKYRYDIFDQKYGHNHISMIYLFNKSVLEDSSTWKYEILGHHGSDTKSFKTYREAINYIKDLYAGKIKHNHYCASCGSNWTDQ